ncbi:transglutaminase-like cysteine peptidase [Hydrogenimonas sp. SS33]|uniref:transglutaminase-like cysteine peptidase n=1 Tax=Hydrogenimonas leucolamina TaxID=2954236 RepID=UPI00336BB8ED
MKAKKSVFWAVAAASAILFAAAAADAFIYKNRLAEIKKAYGPFVAARFRYLDELVDSLRDADIRKKLNEVNDFWNGVRYAPDLKVWGKRDYWATPFEFLLRDRGDCEDYVIAKYFTLKALGIGPSKLYFVYARVRGRRGPHMVLAYYETPKSEPLILDNLNLRVFPASKRKDIIPVYTFNGELLERFRDHSSRGLAKKNLTVRRKWEDLIHRMKGQPL